MKLPNAENAIVDLDKLLLYCLNPLHFRGRHKARVFAAALGIDRNSATKLRELLLAAARTETATLLENNAYGSRFMIEFDVGGSRGPQTIRSIWIVRTEESRPRMVTCYIAQVRK